MGKKIAQNTAIQIIGKILSAFFGIATVAVLARILGVEGYGELTLILSFLAIFATLVDFGFTLTVVQMISEDSKRENSIIGNILTLRILSGFLFLGLAPIIAIFFPYAPVVKLGIAIGAISYLGATTSQMLIGIFQKNLVMSRPVLAELFNRTIVLIGAILAGHLGIGLLGVMWIFVIGNAAQLITVLYFALRYVKIKLQISAAMWREIITRSWPIGASIFFTLIYLRGDIVFLSVLRDNPEAEIGIYGLAYKVIDVLTAIPVMYMGLILPLLVGAWAAKDRDAFSRILQGAFDFFSVTALPVVVGSMLVGTEIITLIAGPEFAEAGRILYLLGPTLLFVFYGALYGHAVVGIQKQLPMTWNYLAVALFTIAGYIIFIPQFGMYGAAVFTLASEMLITLLAFLMVKRYTNHAPNLALFGKSLLAALAMAAVLYLLPSMHVIISILIGAIAYTAVLIMMGGPRPRDLIALFAPEKPPITQG